MVPIFLTAFVALWLSIGQAQACVQSVTSTDTYTEICVAGACARILNSSLRNGSDALREVQLQSLFTNVLQQRTPLSTLPLDDPDRLENPALGERLYWGNETGEPIPTLEAGATHLISQACIVEAVDFDGVSFQLSIRRAQ